MDADTLERMWQQKLGASVEEIQYLQRQLDQANFRLQENLNKYKEFQMKRYKEIQTNGLKTIRKIEMLHQLLGTDKEPAPQRQSEQDLAVEISTQVRSEVAATIGFVENAAIDLMPLRSHNLSETEERLDDHQQSENIEFEPNDDCDTERVNQLEGKSASDSEQSMEVENDHHFQMDISTQVHPKDAAADIVGGNDLMSLRCRDVTDPIELLDDQQHENMPEQRDSDTNEERFLSEQNNCDAEQVNQLVEKSIAMPLVQRETDSEQSTDVENDQDLSMEISTQVHSKDVTTVGIVSEDNLMSLRSHDVAEEQSSNRKERRKDMPEHRDSDQNDESLSSVQCNVDDCDAEQVNQSIEKSVSCTNLALQPGIKSKKSTKRSNSQICQNRQSENRREVNLKRFACDFNRCGRTFRTNSELKSHKRIHSDDRPFQCDVCKNSFRWKFQISDHMKIHTGEKPFQCDICKKFIRRKNHLRVHMKIHTGAKPYECDICKKFFRQKNHISDHMKIHTGEKPFECDICHKSFRQKNTLADHKRIHTGEKPFECDICHIWFRHKNALADHKKIHAEDKNHKPFVCDYCGEKHCYKRSLTQHILGCFKKSPGANAPSSQSNRICRQKFTLKN